MQKVQIEMTLSEEDCTILRLITKQGDTYTGGQGIGDDDLARLTRFGLIYKDKLLGYILTDLGWTLMYHYKGNEGTSRYRIVPTYRWHTVKVDGVPEDESSVLIQPKGSRAVYMAHYYDVDKQFYVFGGELIYELDEVDAWHPTPAKFCSKWRLI